MKKQFDEDAWRLCVVVDAGFLRGRSTEAVTRAAVQGGARLIQFRDKESPTQVFFERAAAVANVCRSAEAMLIVNDRVDVAMAVGAAGVHLGQKDLPAGTARGLVGPDRWIGVSASTPEEARKAQRDGADYLGVGAVYEARGTKPDAEAPIGIEGFRRVAEATNLPIVGIGGINTANAPDVLAAGASGVAVISAVLKESDVAASVRDFLAALSVSPRGDNSS